MFWVYDTAGGLLGVGSAGLVAASQPEVDYLELAIWVGVVVLGVMLIAAVAAICRKRWRSDGGCGMRQAWTLEELRALRESGDLDPGEYVRLRDGVMAKMGILGQPDKAETGDIK